MAQKTVQEEIERQLALHKADGGRYLRIVEECFLDRLIESSGLSREEQAIARARAQDYDEEN